MHKLRAAALVTASLGVIALSVAQIDGPVPLAWRWSGSTAVSPTGTPAFMGDSVFIGVGNRVYGLDKATGNKKWQYPLLDGVDGNFVSSPVVSEGVVYAAASNSTLYAIDPASGEMKWSYTAPGAIIGSPVISGRFIVMNVDGNSIMAVGLDGQPAFVNPERVFDGIFGTLVSNGTSVIYTTSRYEMYQLNVATRRSARMARFESIASNYQPLLTQNNLYVCAGSYVIAMNPLNGGMRWQKSADEKFAFGPAQNVDSVVAVTESGYLHVFDNNGARKTTSAKDAKGNTVRTNMVIDLGSRPIAAPTSVGKLFAVPTSNGAVNLVDTTEGKLVWSYTIRPVTMGLKAASDSGATTRGNEILSIPASGPAIVNGQSMYILAADGSLLCFDHNLGVDLTGPAIKMLWPQAGLQVGNTKKVDNVNVPLDIYLQVTDEATGINDDTMNVTVNGAKVKFDYGRDGILSLQFGNSAMNPPLRDGRAVIEVTVADWMGNSTTSSFSLTIDNSLLPLVRAGGRPGDPAGAGRGRGGKGGGNGGGGNSGR
ncbi:MAG: PQQ-binding-like beta-propeller repeat protein [Fimbriimonadaceae bacterium]